MALTLRKKGRYWYARGTVPMRQANGKITKVRIEDPTREESKTRAARAAQDLWDYYHEQAYRPKRSTASFVDAVITFVETKQPTKRDRQFLTRLIEHFGDLPISDIDQTAMAGACTALYPKAKASTLVRAVYAPTIAVLRMAGLTPRFHKPKIEKVPVVIPSDDWFERLLPHCEPQLKALLLFLSLTGRRITEALEAINNGDQTVTIGRTKTGSSIHCRIPITLSSWVSSRERGKRLFSFGDRHNVYRALRKACERAGVPYYGSHALGRHSFASRLLRKGYSTKFVAQAGGWASSRMVDEIYGHLEKDPVQDEALKVGEEWVRKL